MHNNTSLALLVLCLLPLSILAQNKIEPSFEDILSIESVSNAQISPNGEYVIYQLQSTDWKNNRYDREIWISDLKNEVLIGFIMFLVVFQLELKIFRTLAIVGHRPTTTSSFLWKVFSNRITEKSDKKLIFYTESS